MSDPVLVTIISGVQAVALALIAAWLRRGQDTNHADTQRAIEVVRKDVNGKVQQLIDVSGDAREAKGNLEGNIEGRAAAKIEGEENRP